MDGTFLATISNARNKKWHGIKGCDATLISVAVKNTRDILKKKLLEVSSKKLKINLSKEYEPLISERAFLLAEAFFQRNFIPLLQFDFLVGISETCVN